MRKLLLVATLVLALGAGLAFAGPTEFSKGTFTLTPQVGYASWGGSVPFGVSAEYAVSDIFGVGGTVMGQFWSESYGSVSLVMVLAEADYHFVHLTANKLDLYWGLGLGYGMYSVTYDFGFLSGGSGSSGVRLVPILGGRYYISPKIGISLRILGSIIGSGNSGLGASVGVTFKLK